MSNGSAMNEVTSVWVKGLPMRWALGGLFFGIVWSLISTALVGGFSNPAGGHTAAVIRVFSLIVLPLCILGFTWGWSERLTLERSFAQGNVQFEKAIDRYVFRQTGKAIVCGLVFALFTHGIGIKSFQSWDTHEDIVANVSRFLGNVLPAVPVGIVVGIFSSRALRRRLAARQAPGSAEDSKAPAN